MGFTKSNSPVDLNTASTALPTNLPAIDDKILERFPDWKAYNTDVQEFLTDLVVQVRNLEKELKDNLSSRILSGRGAPTGTPPFGTIYTDNSTGDLWNFSKQGWVRH